MGDGCSPRWRGRLEGGGWHTALLQATLGTGAAGAGGLNGGAIRASWGPHPFPIAWVLFPSPNPSPCCNPPHQWKNALSAYTCPSPWKGGAPPNPPSPPYPPAAGGASPPLREGVYPANPSLPPPTLGAQGERMLRGCWGEAGGGIAARTHPPPAPPSARTGAAPALPPSLPSPPHANDAAQRVRREGGRREGGREGGRGPPYLALSPPLPLTCSGRAMRIPASR